MTKYRTRAVPLAKIWANPDNQVRAMELVPSSQKHAEYRRDRENIEGLIVKIENGVKLDPVNVIQTEDGRYELMHGFHRYKAYTHVRGGLKGTIPARVWQPEYRAEAALDGYRSNTIHTQRFHPSQRSQAAWQFIADGTIPEGTSARKAEGMLNKAVKKSTVSAMQKALHRIRTEGIQGVNDGEPMPDYPWVIDNAETGEKRAHHLSWLSVKMAMANGGQEFTNRFEDEDVDDPWRDTRATFQKIFGQEAAHDPEGFAGMLGDALSELFGANVSVNIDRDSPRRYSDAYEEFVNDGRVTHESGTDDGDF